MVSKSMYKGSGLGMFPGRGDYEFAFNCFDGFNEDYWVSNKRKRFYGEVWGDAA